MGGYGQWRDAVDAVSALDERTAAYGEVVWF
jgi:hypothetical protein